MVVSDIVDALPLQMDALEAPYERCMCSGWSLCFVFLSRQWIFLERTCLQKLMILLCDLLQVKILEDERKLLALRLVILFLENKLYR
jgi:hypothetical protein